MNTVYPFSLIVLLLSTFGCQRPLVVDDDQMVKEASWEKIDFPSERLILGLHATPFELQAITENQFFRFNGDNEPLEIRPFLASTPPLLPPAMSDNTFVRMTTNDDAEQTLEFHLTKNGSQILEIMVDSLKGPGDSFIEVEFMARTLGAFSSDGTLFLLPATVLPDRHYVLLLFEVLHNAAATEFTSVEMFRRIDLPDLSADFANLQNIRYVDGNFYVGSKSGAWRISPDGEKVKIFQQQMRDFFEHEGKLYAMGPSSFSLHESTDNGITWERLNQDSELVWIETAGGTVFTQTAPSQLFHVMDENLEKAKSIVLPAGFAANEAIYYGVAFFAGRHYFSMDRSIYFTEEIVLE